MSKQYELSYINDHYRRLAKALGDYEKIPMDELVEYYCMALDTKDNENADIYIAGIMLRLWSQIPKIHYRVRTLKKSYAESHDMLFDAVMQACQPENRAWQKGKCQNPSQAIFQTLETRFIQAAFYESNLAIHKANYNTISTDATITAAQTKKSEETDATVGDMIEDSRANDFVADLDAEYIVQSQIDKNRVVEAIILDNIAFGDAEKVEKHVVEKMNDAGELVKRTEYSHELWLYKLVQNLNSLPADYKEYFKQRYQVKDEILNAAISSIKNSNNNRLYKSIRAMMATLRTELA